MNSRSPKMPTSRSFASTTGSAGRPLSRTCWTAVPTVSSRRSRGVSRTRSRLSWSGVMASFLQVADRDVGGGEDERQAGCGEPDLEERYESDRLSGPGGHAGGGDVGGGRDQG